VTYGVISSRFWTERATSALSGEAKLLLLYFLTGPLRNAIGCLRAPDAYVLSDLRWALETLSRVVAELEGAGLIVRDPEGWTFTALALEFDPPRGAKRRLGAMRQMNEVPPQSPVHAAASKALARAMTAADDVGPPDFKPTAAGPLTAAERAAYHAKNPIPSHRAR
jgi:hypothetical protein